MSGRGDNAVGVFREGGSRPRRGEREALENDVCRNESTVEVETKFVFGVPTCHTTPLLNPRSFG